jgi:hypothetical protein
MSAIVVSDEIKRMTTPELVAAYNKLTGKSILRFATRAKGEQQVAKAMEKANGKSTAKVEAKAQTKPEKNTPATPGKSAATPRVVKGKAGAAGSGRPRGTFSIQLSGKPGKSTLHKNSLRAQLMNYMQASAQKVFSIETIEQKFNRNMRGVIGKLIEKDWVERVEV